MEPSDDIILLSDSLRWLIEEQSFHALETIDVMTLAQVPGPMRRKMIAERMQSALHDFREEAELLFMQTPLQPRTPPSAEASAKLQELQRLLDE